MRRIKADVSLMDSEAPCSKLQGIFDP